ncbi:MAG: hypothetical protein IPP90_13050 [Gemmatimonadaceae bacterium]|nr:hypothetical protein [Gemmatimonadaceae bacterium]
MGYVDVVTPFGFSGFVGNGACDDFEENWRDFASQRSYVCGYFALHPALDNHVYRSQAYPSNTVYAFDLSLSYAQLWANLHRTRRQELRNWETVKASLLLERSPLERFVLNNYHEFLDRVGAAPGYYLTQATLSRLVQLPNVMLVGIGTPDAVEEVEEVAVIAFTQAVADGLFNVSVRKGKRHTSRLIWYGVETMKSLGVARFNLGGTVHPGDRLTKAKASFGLRETPFYCLKHVYRPDVYVDLCRRVSIDPDGYSGYFPAYRTPS